MVVAFFPLWENNPYPKKPIFVSSELADFESKNPPTSLENALNFQLPVLTSLPLQDLQRALRPNFQVNGI